MSKTTVIVINWNGAKVINRCLKALLSQRLADIIVIDNDSSDGSIAEINKFRNLLKVVSNKSNLGYSGAANQGINNSDSEYVMILNPDVVLGPNFVREQEQLLNLNTKIGVVGGKLIRLDGSIDTAGILLKKNRQVADIKEIKNPDPYEVFAVNGAAPIYRRNALEDVKCFGHIFDEKMFAYKEDADMGWRLRLRGWKCVINPNATALHERGWKENTKRSDISKFKRFLSFRNRHILILKNESLKLFLRDSPYIITFEIGALLYGLFFERIIWKAFLSFILEIPSTLRQRKLIQTRRKITDKEFSKWIS